MTTKAQAAHIASRCATVLSGPRPGQNFEGQSLADGAAGIALLHIERAQARTGPWKLAHRWINHAAAGELDATDTAGLFRGVPALAFVLLNTVPHGRFHELYRTAWEKLHHHVTTLAHQRTERALARIHRGELTTFAEYDLFCGLTGIGAYLLRADPTSSALETGPALPRRPHPPRGHQRPPAARLVGRTRPQPRHQRGIRPRPRESRGGTRHHRPPAAPRPSPASRRQRRRAARGH